MYQNNVEIRLLIESKIDHLLLKGKTVKLSKKKLLSIPGTADKMLIEGQPYKIGDILVFKYYDSETFRNRVLVSVGGGQLIHRISFSYYSKLKEQSTVKCSIESIYSYLKQRD